MIVFLIRYVFGAHSNRQRQGGPKRILSIFLIRYASQVEGVDLEFQRGYMSIYLIRYVFKA